VEAVAPARVHREARLVGAEQGHGGAAGREAVQLGAGRRVDYWNGEIRDFLVPELEAIPRWSWDPNRDRHRRNLDNLRSFVLKHGWRELTIGNHSLCPGGQPVDRRPVGRAGRRARRSGDLLARSTSWRKPPAPSAVRSARARLSSTRAGRSMVTVHAAATAGCSAATFANRSDGVGVLWSAAAQASLRKL
jgi:hypothetical protein